MSPLKGWDCSKEVIIIVSGNMAIITDCEIIGVFVILEPFLAQVQLYSAILRMLVEH